MSQNNTYKIKSQIWIWPGDAGWHFISLDKKLSKKIKEKYINKKYGGGFIKIKATIGSSSWLTALFPYTSQEIYLISVKKKIRTAEDLFEGDNITLKFEIL